MVFKKLKSVKNQPRNRQSPGPPSPSSKFTDQRARAAQARTRTFSASKLMSIRPMTHTPERANGWRYLGSAGSHSAARIHLFPPDKKEKMRQWRWRGRQMKQMAALCPEWQRHRDAVHHHHHQPAAEGKLRAAPPTERRRSSTWGASATPSDRFFLVPLIHCASLCVQASGLSRSKSRQWMKCGHKFDLLATVHHGPTREILGQIQPNRGKFRNGVVKFVNNWPLFHSVSP